ncbi:MAG: site-specific DNA-methyltransferase [Chloroflexota bacterium]|nr:site-specific DNA-methyltransferase [Chloroflexota bacterium]
MTTLNFKGKSVIRTYHLTVPFRQLTPNPKKSLTKSPSLHDNLIVHGDNLLALKALLPSFGGKVKCIYIDPPYNTGNEKWVYNDNVNSPMHQEWLKKAVDREDLTRHEKWLCMMWPRLVLLRELLAEDGVIFISIDDNEVHHLREIMDEIFGEENFVASIVWQKVYSPRMDAKGFSEDHDYILVYRRSEQSVVGRISFEQNLEQFSSVDNSTGKQYRPRSLRKEGKNSRRIDRPNLFYPLISPDGTKIFPIRSDGSEGCWRWSLKKYEEAQSIGLIEWVNTENGWQVYVKQFYTNEATKPPGTIWLHKEVGHNHQAADELKNIFGALVFDSPKPTALIKRILEIATDEDDIVLDSFAGSGTTAQAVLELNAEREDSNRKFILIEQEDYADKITAERVRRVIKGVKKSNDERIRDGLGGTFTYYTLGDALAEENLLRGGKMPSYMDLARYVFFTSTGEQLDDIQVKEKRWYLGESRSYEVYLLYQPDVEFLKHRPLDLEFVNGLGNPKGKTRLVIASHKYVDDFVLQDKRVEFCQLPFAIYRFRA